MLKRISTVLFFVFVLAYGPQPATCFAKSISSAELINNAKGYDGKTVSYEGEAIGDIMKRGEYAWINVNDGINAIGIWINVSLLRDINYIGSYKSSGDKIEVKGIFHRACLEHGGDLDIHAESVRKIESGRMIDRKTDPAKRNLSLILGGVLVLIWILSLFKRK
ncbi:MAG: DNA-binding protein [Candidatus Omnitrophica bacterium]|nr:DNA-binding protein [Candidatus Omnitrophota bacterium]